MSGARKIKHVYKIVIHNLPFLVPVAEEGGGGGADGDNADVVHQWIVGFRRTMIIIRAAREKGGAGNDCTACVTRCGRDGIGEEKVPVAFPPLRIDFEITDISANFCAVPSDIGDWY